MLNFRTRQHRARQLPFMTMYRTIYNQCLWYILISVCTQLLVSARPEDECFGLYVQLLDKCMMHEVSYIHLVGL